MNRGRAESEFPFIEGTRSRWDVKVSPLMNPQERSSLTDAFHMFTDIAFARFRYNAMATRPFACFQAVDIWKSMQPAYKPLIMEDSIFVFDRKVKDVLGIEEKGQYMLSMTYPNFESRLVIDVAGYLFGFPYDRIPAAMGEPEFLDQAISEFYQERYEGLVLQHRQLRGIVLPNSQTPQLHGGQ